MKSKILLITKNGFARDIERLLSHNADVKVVDEKERPLIQKEVASGRYAVCVVRSKEVGDAQYDLLQFVKSVAPSARIILSVGSATVDDAVRYIKAGAADFLVGSETDPRLLHSVRRFLPPGGGITTESRSPETKEEETFLGKNPKIQEVLAAVGLVARSTTAVLITGESGTGKELVARMIHQQSDRAQKPFIALNAAAIPKDLIESELFGHERGAFTGASSRKEGCFELARDGTIFFDEIAEMNADTQAKLLRAIEHRSFRRVGGKEEIIVDVRAVAATNKNIYEAMKKGEFREDLYYRFSVIEIHLPALRDRKDDIPVLLDHFLSKYGRQYGKQMTQRFSDESMDLLMEYQWPGNVRELRNVVERAVVICPHPIIGPRYLPGLITKQKEPQSYITIPLGISAREAERKLILETLAAVNHNKSKAARILGLSRKTLHNKLAEMRIESSHQGSERDGSNDENTARMVRTNQLEKRVPT